MSNQPGDSVGIASSTAGEAPSNGAAGTTKSGKLKVLYINYLFDRTYSSVGAAVHVKEFSDAARAIGVNIQSCDLNKFGSESAAVTSKTRAWLKSKLSRYVGQFNALLSNIGYFKREWRMVEMKKPDALLVRYNLLNFSAALVARLKGIPLILEVNSPMALESRQFNKNTVNLPLVLEWFEKLNMKLASRVYAVSDALKDYLVSQGVSATKVSVVPNGVNVERFHPKLSGADVRTAHGLEGAIVLGFVGSFHYWHGVESLAPYVEQLCAKYENVRFLLVGNGPLKDELEATFRDKRLSDKVVFVGYIEHDRIPEYLAAMDIMLAPYPAMDFFYFSPLKLYEYMAAGKPAIASKVGQIEEMLQDGVNGVLYEAGNSEQFLAKSCQLIESEALRQSLGRRARELVCAKYSWKTNAAAVVGLIEKALQERRSSSISNGES